MINHNDFVGKTIQSIDSSVVNAVVFHFTDGTKAELEVVAVLPSLGLHGIQSTGNSSDIEGMKKSNILPTNGTPVKNIELSSFTEEGLAGFPTVTAGSSFVNDVENLLEKEGDEFLEEFKKQADKNEFSF